MSFKGYALQFRFKKYNAKHHRKLFAYSFESLRNGCNYIIEAFYYETADLFIIKFYNKSGRGKNKYATVTNKGDVRNILMTNFNLIKLLSEQFPAASFCFMGERRFFKEEQSGLVLIEDAADNIRYRVYKLFIQQEEIATFLHNRFIRKYKDSISSCLFLNKNNTLFPSQTLYLNNICDMLGKEFPEIRFSV